MELKKILALFGIKKFKNMVILFEIKFKKIKKIKMSKIYFLILSY